jgi:hypothetical protein
VKQLQVLLAVKPPLFGEILGKKLRKDLAGHARVVVMDEVRGAQDVRDWARDYKADVVLATIEPTQEVPELVTGLLAQFPDLMVVGISPHQASIRTYVIQVRTIADSSSRGIALAVLERAKSDGSVD